MVDRNQRHQPNESPMAHPADGSVSNRGPFSWYACYVCTKPPILTNDNNILIPDLVRLKSPQRTFTNEIRPILDT